MKTCFKCGLPKHLTEFYKHPEMADGRLGKCKLCTRLDTIVNRRMNLNYYRQYDRDRSSLPHRVEAREIYQKGVGRPKCDAAKRRWSERNPRKRKAQKAFHNAQRHDPSLAPQPCERCGANDLVHGHHENYDFPYRVNWLCPKHHKERHAEMRNQGIEP